MKIDIYFLLIIFTHFLTAILLYLKVDLSIIIIILLAILFSLLFSNFYIKTRKKNFIKKLRNRW
jgi:hypothetical protein